jgi:glycosidase
MTRNLKTNILLFLYAGIPQTTKRLKLYFVLLCMLALLPACSNDNSTWTDVPNIEVKPITSKNKVIYEANVYAYSKEGNFKGLEKDLPRLKELGVDILWLMPIHPIGIENRSGTLGSPYSVKDYKAINPDYGTEDDFKSLIKSAHSLNIEIWMDWVANHTAWDNVWVGNHLDFYAEKAGKRPYSPGGWSDVIQLDYNNTEMCDSMINAMKYWVREFNIDGYRCDAAALVPLSFWIEARKEVDAIKKITWLCEADDPTYMQAFDYNYDWLLSNAMNKFGKDNDLSSLVNTCASMYSDTAYKDKSRMVFFTNHDLNAFEGTEFQRFGNNVLPFTVFMFTIYDMPLIYNGQEIGMNKVMNFAERSLVEWDPTNKVYENLYKKLTQLKRTQLALEDGSNRGDLKVYSTNQENVMAYSRTKGDNEILIILNFSNIPVRVRFTGDKPTGKFKDYLKNTYVNLSDIDGISLLQNGYAVYVK